MQYCTLTRRLHPAWAFSLTLICLAGCGTGAGNGSTGVPSFGGSVLASNTSPITGGTGGSHASVNSNATLVRSGGSSASHTNVGGGGVGAVTSGTSPISTTVPTGTATTGGASSGGRGGAATNISGSGLPVGGKPSAGGAGGSGGAVAVGGTRNVAIGGTNDGGRTTMGGSGTTTSVQSGMSGAAGTLGAAINKVGEVEIAFSGLTVVSYGGYLNGESFQQDGIITHGEYQYTAFWNTKRHVVMARRKLPSGTWSKFEFTDYTNAEDDAHNTISLGVCPGDGTLHLAFDHHSSDLHYRRSNTGFLNNDSSPWDATSFTAVSNGLVGSTRIALLTYPRFVTEPGGTKMLLSARTGTSGSGDEELWEYDAQAHVWMSIGKYINGITDSVNAYLHGLVYSPGGGRLHACWCWRETPDATTNHDLFYVYSDDAGRTWKNNAGTVVGVAGSAVINKDTLSARVWTIGQNRGLINQEHMAVDSKGQVHVLLSHMPEGQADDSDFTSARVKSVFFHYWRNGSGSWTRTPIGLPVIQNFRGKLAISSTNNVYAILPDLRIAAASATANYTDWSLLNSTDSGRFFSDPLIDTSRLAKEDHLTIYYPQKSSVNIWALDYSIR